MTSRVAEECRQDLRYAFRMLRRRPGFAAAAILTLTLGIGGNTAVFSLVHALLLTELPVERPEELIRLVEERLAPATPRETFTLANYSDLQRNARALSGVIASSEPGGGRPLEIEERGERHLVYLQFVSDNYFDVLGLPVFRGRMFGPPQPGGRTEPIAVISYDYWRRHYAADTSALGTRFRMRTGARAEFTIAGIAPPGFRGTAIDVPIDIWVPIDHVVPVNDPDRASDRWMQVMGRLRPGTTVTQADAEATAIVGRTVTFQPGDNGYSRLRRQLSQPLLLVGVVVSFVLLIACANLANLMLASTTSRARELAVRTTMGASRGRVMQQLITESLVLSVAGGVLAIGAAHWISAALISFLPPDQAIAAPHLRFAFDANVLGFAALLAFATCLMFGLAPAVRATSRLSTASFRAGHGTGERHANWLSRGLVISQIVMCTALLVASGVFLRSLQNLRGQEAGYREDQLLVAEVQPPFEYTEERRDQLIEDLRTRVAALPHVEVAAFSHVGQMSGSTLVDIGFPGRTTPDGDKTRTIETRVSPGFLRAMGTPLLAGRDFTESDDERGQLVAIVNESFAQQFLTGRNPIGERFFRAGPRSGELMEIIGVVRDTKWANLRDNSPSMYYRPYRQMGGTPAVRFAIRSSGDPRALAALLTQTARTIDRHMAVRNIVPFSDIIDRTLVIERLVAQVSAAFGALALLIAAIGLYGVLAYSVVRRRREIGVRIAIGAPPGAVEWMVMRESLVLVVCGVTIGLPIAIGTTRLMSSILFGLSPQDLGSTVAALAVLVAATVFAAYLPARRAAGIDPILALRDE